MSVGAEQRPTETQEGLDGRFRQLSSGRFLTFVDGIKIPSADGPRVFRDCMVDFQREFFHAIAPSLHAVRDGTVPKRRRFWMERTKGAAKDSDLALCVLWLVAFATRPTYFQVGAADRDQAAILRSRIKDLIHYNEWLNQLVKIHRSEISHYEQLATLDIMASDSRSAHGGTPDLLILNELVHVNRWEFAEALMSNAAKVPRGVVVIATNAGYKGTEAEKWRDNCMKDGGLWDVFVRSSPAPWISERDVKDEMSRLPPSAAQRLWMGIWASGKGDALSEEDINRVFRADLRPLEAPEDGWRYVAGLDLAVKQHHAGLVVLGVNAAQQRIRVARMHDFVPNPKVNLIEVENTCFAMHQLFRTCWFGCDPYEAGTMIQQLGRRGLYLQEVGFVPKNLTEMAEALVQVTASGLLECYEDETLRRDFGKFYIKEKNYGVKLEAVSDQHGHADVGTALVICLPTALKMLAGGGGQLPDDHQFVLEDDKPLTKKEIKEMPDVLRGIYEMDGEEEGRQGRMVDMSGREIRR